MGAWGIAIFSDDLAADVRSEFRALLGDGLSAEEATRELEARYSTSLDDEDDGPVFWIALAAAQHRLGRLQPHVLAKALEAIDGGTDLRRWEDDPKARLMRERVLQQTRETLTTPQPSPKRVSKTFRNESDWAVGQVVAYRLPSGSFCAFVTIGHHEDRGGRSPVVELLDWVRDGLPSEGELRRARVRPTKSSHGEPQMMIGATSAREKLADRIVVLPFRLTPSQRPNGFIVSLWRMLDRTLEQVFDLR